MTQHTSFVPAEIPPSLISFSQARSIRDTEQYDQLPHISHNQMQVATARAGGFMSALNGDALANALLLPMLRCPRILGWLIKRRFASLFF